MKKINKILVATDFSQHSDSALLLGKEIQNKLGAELHIVHISDIAPIWDLPASDMQAKNLLAQFQTEIDKSLKTKMRDQLIKCQIQTEGMIKFGNSQKELLSTIDSTKADLLIMGHRGHTGFFGVGSFAEKMIASSPIPVLIAKNKKDIKNVNYLIDPSWFSEKSISFSKEFAHSISAQFKYLMFIAEPSSASLIDIPFVMPSFKFSEQEKEDIAHNAKTHLSNQSNDIAEGDIHVEISHLSTSKALTKALVEQQSDLAIVSKHNRGSLEKFFIGSTSKGILQEFAGNILVLPS
jgi:nucleotide-binding universal stress UspA family protein